MAPGVVACRTGGHIPGHSVVRLASGGDRLTFAGDAVFPVGSDRPDWHNVSNTTPRRRPAFGSVFAGAGGDRPVASAHSLAVLVHRPRWRSTATSFVGYRSSGTTDRLVRHPRCPPPPNDTAHLPGPALRPDLCGAEFGPNPTRQWWQSMGGIGRYPVPGLPPRPAIAFRAVPEEHQPPHGATVKS